MSIKHDKILKENEEILKLNYQLKKEYENEQLQIDSENIIINREEAKLKKVRIENKQLLGLIDILKSKIKELNDKIIILNKNKEKYVNENHDTDALSSEIVDLNNKIAMLNENKATYLNNYVILNKEKQNKENELNSINAKFEKLLKEKLEIINLNFQLKEDNNILNNEIEQLKMNSSNISIKRDETKL